jgi:hypothetical protein
MSEDKKGRIVKDYLNDILVSETHRLLNQKIAGVGWALPTVNS